MNNRFNFHISALSLLVALTILTTLCGPVAFAAEDAEPTGSAFTGGEAFAIRDEEATTTETQPDYDNGILLQWELDSTLSYVLDADNYVWTVYDASGNPLSGGEGEAAYAGYALTGTGTWYGSATVKLMIVNTLDVEVKLRLLFHDDLSAAAVAISSTLDSQDQNVTYDSDTGEMIIQPDAEGVVTMVITAEVLQNVNAVITEEDTIPGHIQVQVLSPLEAPAKESDSTTEPTTEPTAEPTTEPTAEPTTEPTTEPTAEPTTEPADEPTEELPSE